MFFLKTSFALAVTRVVFAGDNVNNVLAVWVEASSVWFIYICVQCSMLQHTHTPPPPPPCPVPLFEVPEIGPCDKR